MLAAKFGTTAKMPSEIIAHPTANQQVDHQRLRRNDAKTIVNAADQPPDGRPVARTLDSVDVRMFGELEHGFQFELGSGYARQIVEIERFA